MATTTIAPRQVEGLEQAYQDIKALKQEVKELTERLAKAEKASQVDQRQFTSAVQEALRQIKRNG